VEDAAKNLWLATGAGIYHQGGLQATMEELQSFATIDNDKLEEHIVRRIELRDRILGFGHRFHKVSEPRARLLMELADNNGFSGPHIAVAKRVEEILRRVRPLPMNIEAAGGAILLDLGFDPAIGHLIIILGRSPMFAAAYLERLAEGRKPFQKIEVSDVLDR
jgi:citrate synthase